MLRLQWASTHGVRGPNEETESLPVFGILGGRR